MLAIKLLIITLLGLLLLGKLIIWLDFYLIDLTVDILGQAAETGVQKSPVDFWNIFNFYFEGMDFNMDSLVKILSIICEYPVILVLICYDCFKHGHSALAFFN